MNTHRMLVGLAGLLCAIAAKAASPSIVMEEFMVPAADPGISVYVRNKHPEGMQKVAGEKIVLFVHGATYPAETAFDLRLNGVSWMDYIAARGYVQHNDKVAKLVLYAPQWLRTTPSLTGAGGTLAAYRTVSRDAAKTRWLTGVPENKKADLIPAGWLDAWADATFASDPVGAARSPPVLRAPNGVVADGSEFWSAGKPLYDPAGVRVPTLLAHPNGTPIFRTTCSTPTSRSS